MRKLLDTLVLDNTLRAYLEVLGTVLLALIVKRFISRYLAGLLYRLVTKTGRNFNKKAFCDLLIEPLEVFLMLLVVIIALDQLQYPHYWNFKVYKLQFSDILDGVARLIMIITFIWLCLRIIDFIATVLEERASLSKSQSDNQLIVFFKDFFKVVLVIIGILLLIRFVFQKDVGNLLTGLSIVGAAIALATRESLENLIASFIIFFDKPFVTGDTVKVHSFTGTIEKIGLRSTRIRTTDKTYITVPNKQMVDSIVDNISLRTQRKADLKLELKLTVSAAEIKKLLEAIKKILSAPHILKSTVHFSETGRNSNVITIEYFSGIELSDEEFNNLKEQVNFKIKELVENEKIEFASFNIDPSFFSKQAGSDR